MGSNMDSFVPIIPKVNAISVLMVISDISVLISAYVFVILVLLMDIEKVIITIISTLSDRLVSNLVIDMIIHIL